VVPAAHKDFFSRIFTFFHAFSKDKPHFGHSSSYLSENWYETVVPAAHKYLARVHGHDVWICGSADVDEPHALVLVLVQLALDLAVVGSKRLAAGVR
jgi:hypothetical protein